MAHTQGTSARIQRLTSLVAVVLIAGATGLAFGRVYLGHTATYQLIAVGVASGVVAWALERRSLVLATLVSAVLLVVAIGWLVFPESTWYGLPTMHTLHDIAHAAGQVGRQARVQVSPAPATDALLFAGITAVWAALFSCHALAFRAGSPILALVPPVALVVFADSVLEEFIKPWYGVYFLIAALAVMYADSLRRLQGWGAVWSIPGRRNRLLPATGRSARRVGVFAVALAVVAPALVPGFGSKAVIDLSTSGNDTVQLSPFVSIAAKLQQGTAQPVFTVKTTHPSYWRMAGLDVYGTGTSGTTWIFGNDAAQSVSGQSLDRPAADGTTIEETFTTDSDWGFTEVPVAPRPTSISVPDRSLTWASGPDIVRVDDPLHRGTTYTVVSSTPDPTRTELSSATVPTGTPYTQLPGDLPDRLLQIAREWTAGATTPYEQVLAIQRHLLSLRSGFTYNQYVEYGDDPQSLVRFLDRTRMGFCQQYASAMAVLLRELHIPARVAVGFTTGTQDPDNPDIWSVDTHNYHAWVEVLFDQWGWLGFEATPGIANPATSSYQASVVAPRGDVICPPHQPRCNRPSGSVSPTPPVSVSPHTRTLAPATDGGTAAGTSWVPLLVILALVLLLLFGSAIPLVLEVRRRRRLRRASDARARILATYGVFSDRAARLGLPRSPGETAEEYRARVQASGRLTDGHVDRLTRLAVRAAYAPQDPSAEDALDAQADAEQAVRELRDSTSWRRRLLGLYVSAPTPHRERKPRR